MNQLTRIAKLPGSGAGCSAALRAETVPVEKKGQKWYTPAEVEAIVLDRVCQRIVSDLITKPLNAWLESEEGAKAIAALKEPAVGKDTTVCRWTVIPQVKATPPAEFLSIKTGEGRP